MPFVPAMSPMEQEHNPFEGKLLGGLIRVSMKGPNFTFDFRTLKITKKIILPADNDQTTAPDDERFLAPLYTP